LTLAEKYTVLHFSTKGTPNARNYHSFYIFGFRVKKLSSTVQFSIIASQDPLVCLTTGLDLREDLVEGCLEQVL
jgi:hypothetical protein